MPEPNFTFRDTRPGDADALIEKADMAFGAIWDSHYIDWKYFNNPAGRFYGRCAEIDGRPVGFYGNIPVTLKLGDSPLRAAQAVDAMIAPEARRTGVFTRLANETFAQMDQEGIQLDYAFPNPISEVGFVQRLGWTPVGRITRYIKILNPKHILAEDLPKGLKGILSRWVVSGYSLRFSETRRAGSKKLAIRSVDEFDERVDALWKSASAGLPISVQRERTYLNWRYIQNPQKCYTLLIAERDAGLSGLVVLSFKDQAIHRSAALTEFFTLPDDKEAGLALLHAASQVARQHGSAQLQCWMLPQHRFYSRLLEDAGFIFRPSSWLPGILQYTSPLIIRLAPSQHLTPDPTRLENWFVSMGDHDYF